MGRLTMGFRGGGGGGGGNHRKDSALGGTIFDLPSSGPVSQQNEQGPILYPAMAICPDPSLFFF